MFSIAIAFLYVLTIAYSIGNLTAFLCEKFMGYHIKHFTGFVWAGIAFLTVYAQFFSIFDRVGLSANIILIAGCLVSNLCIAKKLLSNLKAQLSPGRLIAGCCLFLLFAYGTSRGVNHYDTGLYHAQAIRWVEEYGVVKGLGLLHFRFAYNSAAFPLSALFSFGFLGISQSMHEMAGFFAFVLSLELVDLYKVIKYRRIVFSDILRVGIFYYLTLIFSEMVSPASDYFVMSAIFYIIFTWVKLSEERQTESTPYGLLCIMGVFACTLKFSACFIVLLVIYPVFLLFKEKKQGRIPIYLGTGFFTILPFFIRNVIISGRLLYPSTLFDFFNVDWKIPKETADYDRICITAWARGIQSSEGYYTPFKEWFPAYFAGQSAMTKLMFLLDAAAFVVFVAALVYVLVKKKKGHTPWIVLVTVTYINFAVWFITAPMVRYGYVYLICPSLLVFGYLLLQKKWQELIAGIFCGLFMLWKLAALGIYVLQAAKAPFYLWQQPYEQYEVYKTVIDSQSFYLPAEGDRTGYDFFPSAPAVDIKLRGEGLESGFSKAEP